MQRLKIMSWLITRPKNVQTSRSLYPLYFTLRIMKPCLEQWSLAWQLWHLTVTPPPTLSAPNSSYTQLLKSLIFKGISTSTGVQRTIIFSHCGPMTLVCWLIQVCWVKKANWSLKMCLCFPFNSLMKPSKHQSPQSGQDSPLPPFTDHLSCLKECLLKETFSAFLLYMKTWCDTYCINVVMIRMTPSSLMTSVVFQHHSDYMVGFSFPILLIFLRHREDKSVEVPSWPLGVNTFKALHPRLTVLLINPCFYIWLIFTSLSVFHCWLGATRVFFDSAAKKTQLRGQSFSSLLPFCWKTYISHVIQPAVHNTFCVGWLCNVSVCDVFLQGFLQCCFSSSSFRPQSQPSQPAKATPTRGWWSSLRRRKGWASTWWAARSRTRPFTSLASSQEAWPRGTAAWSEGISCCPSMAW